MIDGMTEAMREAISQGLREAGREAIAEAMLDARLQAVAEAFNRGIAGAFKEAMSAAMREPMERGTATSGTMNDERGEVTPSRLFVLLPATPASAEMSGLLRRAGWKRIMQPCRALKRFGLSEAL